MVIPPIQIMIIFVITPCKKLKQSLYRPGQALKVLGGWVSQISRQSAHEGGKVVSIMQRPLLPPPPPFPQEIFLVLVSVRSGGGRSEWKIPMAPSGIETAPFWLGAQCLNQLRHRRPLTPCTVLWNYQIRRYKLRQSSGQSICNNTLQFFFTEARFTVTSEVVW
jgi:hypothetical protein